MSDIAEKFWSSKPAAALDSDAESFAGFDQLSALEALESQGPFSEAERSWLYASNADLTATVADLVEGLVRAGEELEALRAEFAKVADLANAAMQERDEAEAELARRGGT